MTDDWKFVIDKNIEKLYDPKRTYSKDVKYIDEDLNPCGIENAVCQLIWGADGLLFAELDNEGAPATDA